MVTKFIECPHDDVMGLCTKFGYAKGLLRNWLTTYLAALPSNLIGCSGQMVLNFKNLFNVFCQAWPEDHVCQVSK
jgi:hypothetical protein